MRDFDIDQVRADFPILSQRVHGRDLVYLDSGATAQKPQVVIDVVNHMHSVLNGNIHRGLHYMAEQTTVRYEAARELVRQFIGARSAAEIVFTSGATEAINLVANSFTARWVRAGDNIVVSEMEHHSNIVPWQLAAARVGAEIRVLPFGDDGALRVELLGELLDERTRLVAVTQCSNVLGTHPDLRAVIEMAHGVGARVLVDGCQGVVHDMVDVVALDVDFYAFSGHKLYGPTGTGVLYGRESLLEEMPPFMGGGDMVARVSFAHTSYAELPLKFEAGTANYIGAIGLGAAVDYVSGFDRGSVYAHEQMLLNYMTDLMERTVDGVRIYGNMADKGPIISFNIEGVHPMDLGMIVDKLGVAIRTGTHCAEPVMTHYGMEAMSRISFGMYNTVAECDAAGEALLRAVGMLRG